MTLIYMHTAITDQDLRLQTKIGLIHFFKNKMFRLHCEMSQEIGFVGYNWG